MKIFFALSLLVIYVSARFTITKIEADDQPCSELNISIIYVYFFYKMLIYFTDVTFPLVSADFRSVCFSPFSSAIQDFG